MANGNECLLYAILQDDAASLWWSVVKLRNLFAAILVIVTVVLVVTVGSGFQLYGTEVSEDEQETLQSRADSTAVQLEALISGRTRTVEVLASDTVFVADPANEADRNDSVLAGTGELQRITLQRFIETTEFQGVSIINTSGRMVGIEATGLSEANRRRLIGTDFTNRSYFQRAKQGEPYVSEPVEAETGNFIVTVSVPVERDGESIGTVNAALHLQESEFFDSIAPDADSETAVRVATTGETVYETGPWEQSELLTANAEETTTGWTVTVARPDAVVGEQAQTVTILQIGAVVLVVATLLGFALWFYQTSIRQTERVLGGFDRLADHEYGTEIDVGGTEEWSRIGRRFNAVSAELARHERELKQYREVVERLEDPIMLQDTEGRFRLVNEATTEYAGRTEAELIGKTEAAFVDDETRAAFDSHREAVLTEERPVEHEVEPVVDRDGPQRVFSVRQNPYYDDTGALAGTISIWRDVTRLKENETELTQYKRAIQEATDLICVIDTDEQYLFANPQYRSYHGVEQAELGGQTVADVLGAETYATVETYLDRALNGAIVKYQSTRLHPTRGERALDVRYYPLDENGETTGVVAVLRDVTEREERAQQLRVVDRVLRHNLRNDLTVIGLQAERIRSGSSGMIELSADEIIEHADALLTTSNKSRSITDVLSEEPSVRAADIVPMVREAVDTVVETHDVDITVESPEEAYANTTAYFSQAVQEVVENGVEHTDQPKPAVELEITVDDDWVRLCVIDNGPGITEMDKDVLETGRTTDELYHGSGLGLWLVYWIVHRSGGSVTVHDDQPVGTTVEIQLSRAGPV